MPPAFCTATIVAGALVDPDASGLEPNSHEGTSSTSSLAVRYTLLDSDPIVEKVTLLAVADLLISGWT